MHALAVSLVEEGLELRAAGIRAPIVVLGAYYNRHQATSSPQRLTPVVYDEGDLERFARGGGAARTAHGRAREGRHRHEPARRAVDELPRVLARFGDLPALRLAGLCTHLASADLPDARRPSRRWTRSTRCMGRRGGEGFADLAHHVANSAAAVRFPARAARRRCGPGWRSTARCHPRHVALPGLEPALRLSTRIMALHDIAAGTPVSYGGLWRAARPSRDRDTAARLRRRLPAARPRTPQVLVGGRRVPIVGAVCMDMLMVDVTDVPPADAGLGAR